MKWFKHMTDVRRDEFILEIKRRFKHRGVYMWWALLETIAEQMDIRYSDKCSISMSFGEWLKILDAKRHIVLPFIQFLGKKKGINVTSDNVEMQHELEMNSTSTRDELDMNSTSSRLQLDFTITIEVRKLLELRDSRNNKVPTIGTIEEEEEEEKEIHKEKPATPTAKKKPATPKTKGVKTALKDNQEIVDMYELTNEIPEGWEAWARKKGVVVDVRNIFENFCRNHLKRESMWVDWYRTWQTWIDNAKDHNPEYFLKIANTDKKADYLYSAFLENIGDGDPHYSDWVLLKSQLKHQCPKHEVLSIDKIREQYGKK